MWLGLTHSFHQQHDGKSTDVFAAAPAVFRVLGFPHREEGGRVNPLLFLPYEYLDNLALELHDTNPVSLTLICAADQLDFNRLLVETSGRRSELDLNRRVGVDPADRDNPEPPGVFMRYSAPDFSVGSTTYELTVTLLDLPSWPGSIVTAFDLWRGGRRITR